MNTSLQEAFGWLHPTHPDHASIKNAASLASSKLNYGNLLVEWDDNSLKEVEEAKKIYQKARLQQRLIVNLNGTPIEFFHPSLLGFEIRGKALNEGQFSVRILNEKGDETLIWDSNDPQEIAEAAAKFSSYLNKGWTAYAVSPDGRFKRKIKFFDSATLEITFQEPGKEKSFKEKLSSFVGKFPALTMLPKTYPG